MKLHDEFTMQQQPKVVALVRETEPASFQVRLAVILYLPVTSESNKNYRSLAG